ncbi:RibD family protein [Oscillochloris sp. ZM17-4]|uniref:RibD family protein n=1 Tax=Oscillochloris sp. ZM17-4 TaxID=2866714 RepID=UPI001C72CC66|nr:RibD family protein [Oscillochloris sp. ZM17-4]MBX0327222.1 RibD family protein [Oscillochloris sp. ZM17-4]
MTLPRVTLCYAQTLDGRTATASGSSQWISGPESLRFSHGLRASHDAIMVGVGTVLADDPRLTVRLAEGRDPLRVVADSRLRTPPDAAVLRDGAGAGTILAHTGRAPADLRAALEATGATLLDLPDAPGGGVALAALLMALDARGVRSLMVEGGARLITAMLRMRLATHMAVTLAPKILGAGTDAVGDLGIARLGDAYSLADVDITPYGADLVIAGRVVYP